MGMSLGILARCHVISVMENAISKLPTASSFEIKESILKNLKYTPHSLIAFPKKCRFFKTIQA